jgi:hypothetical protein
VPKRRNESTAAELLSTWTDSDTAMQIVGTTLGIFGAGFLDPEIVLASETPLRNALFDVLLSLAEGGAVDVRPTGDGYYAFRWRKDYALGALSSDRATTIDIDAPSPYLLELADARRERDAAIARAEAAEALAAEREDSLRRIGGLLQSGGSAPLFDQDDPATDVAEDPPDEIDLRDEDDAVDLVAAETGDVVYMTPPPRKRPTRKELDERLAHALAPDFETEPAVEDDDESDESRSHNSKWSAYALDTPGGPLAPVERVAHEG